MDSKEARALGQLAGTIMGGTASYVEEMHHEIFRRSAAGAAGLPVEKVHNSIATPIYKAVRRLNRALGRIAGVGVALTRPPESARLSESRGGSLALSALSGLYGDMLDREASDLAVQMSLRVQGQAVSPTERELRQAFPRATPRLVTFVHGLCEDEHAWGLFGRRDSTRPVTYGDRLSRDLGFTPLYLRYNTGLHVSDNGRRLSELLEAVVGAWPVPVEEIALIGHSMGGLVARSACNYGDGAGATWVGRLGHVFCLGSPHLGAPLEKAANDAGWTLGRVPEIRPFAGLVNRRSAGIKDLRFGYVVDDDWRDRDPDALLEDNRRDIPFVETANYYFIAATLSRDPRAPVGLLVGDLLVRLPSASGKGSSGRRIPFPIENGRHVGGLNHFHLLNHPDVYEQIRAWLERGGRTTAHAHVAAPMRTQSHQSGAALETADSSSGAA